MATSLREIVGRNVAAERTRRRLNQGELAEKAGVDTATVGRVERADNDPGLEVIEALARALGIAPAKLLEDV